MRRMSSVLVALVAIVTLAGGTAVRPAVAEPAAAATAVGPDAWLDALTIPVIQARFDRGVMSSRRAHRRLPAPHPRARRRRELDPEAEPRGRRRGGGQRRVPTHATVRAAGSRASRCCSRTTSTPRTSATRPGHGRCSGPARPRTRSSCAGSGPPVRSSSARRTSPSGPTSAAPSPLRGGAPWAARPTTRTSSIATPADRPAGRVPRWPPRSPRSRSGRRPTARSSARPA